MTWTGADKAIVSAAHHAHLLLFCFSRLDERDTINQVKQIDFTWGKVMLAVLTKTLYALIQPCSEPCLLLSPRYVSVLLYDL